MTSIHQENATINRGVGPAELFPEGDMRVRFDGPVIVCNGLLREIDRIHADTCSSARIKPSLIKAWEAKHGDIIENGDTIEVDLKLEYPSEKTVEMHERARLTAISTVVVTGFSVIDDEGMKKTISYDELENMIEKPEEKLAHNSVLKDIKTGISGLFTWLGSITRHLDKKPDHDPFSIHGETGRGGGHRPLPENLQGNNKDQPYREPHRP